MTVHQLPLPSLPRADRGWVTTSELINESGISWRQVTYFIRTGLLTPLNANPGSGHPLRFHESQVDRAHLIHDLLDAGINLGLIREHLDQLLAVGRLDVGPVTITIRQTGETA